MTSVNGKLKLSEVAQKLGMRSTALKFHLTNGSGLAKGAEKAGGVLTGEWLLEKQSVLDFLKWAYSNSRKLSFDRIRKLEEELNA